MCKFWLQDENNGNGIFVVILLLVSTYTIIAQKFYSEFTYNNGITIKNSYPKGGQKYTDTFGREYIYVVFWTSITNESDVDLELTINFPSNHFIAPSTLNTKFYIFLPKEEMTKEKEPLYNYGLHLESFENRNIRKSSNLVKNIRQNQSYLFYTVVFSDQRIQGVMRTEYELQNQNVYYNINGLKIDCGHLSKK